MAKIFGATSTTDEVLEGVSLSGKRVLVTGVSAGLGVETARALAAHGAQVVGAARDLSKAKAATAQVRADAANGGGLELVELDLASLASVRACADALLADGRAVRPRHRQRRRHGLPVRQDRRRVRDPVRHKSSWPFRAGQPHRLAHEAGIAAGQPVLRRPSLLRRRSRRSELRAHALCRSIAYGRSKTANVLFAVEFDRRHKANGIRATAVPSRRNPDRALPPPDGRGDAAADRPDQRGQRRRGEPPFSWKTHSPRRGDVRLGRSGREAPRRSAAAIARTATWRRWPRSPTAGQACRPYALDPERAKALWAKSEEMVAERF